LDEKKVLQFLASTSEDAAKRQNLVLVSVAFTSLKAALHATLVKYQLGGERKREREREAL